MRRVFFASQIGAVILIIYSPSSWPHELGSESAQTYCATSPGASVIHFPTFHWTKQMEGDPEEAKLLERAAKSQHSIARFLDERPEFSVFQDSLLEDFDKAFLQELSRQPRSIVAAAKTLFLLGKIQRIHRTMKKSEGLRITHAIENRLREKNASAITDELIGNDKSLRSLVMDQRERAAMKEIQGFLAQNRDRKAILLFGEKHDFSKHFEKTFERVVPCPLLSFA